MTALVTLAVKEHARQSLMPPNSKNTKSAEDTHSKWLLAYGVLAVLTSLKTDRLDFFDPHALFHPLVERAKTLLVYPRPPGQFA